MIYRYLVFPALSLLDPEFCHDLARRFLKIFFVIYLLKMRKKFFGAPTMPTHVGERYFLNPLGLAAGFDKNGDLAEAAYLLGFGFHEIGTVVPEPQAGNARPRVFRLVKCKALINRLGFNSEGLVAASAYIDQFCSKYGGSFPFPVMISIGKNKDTPLELATEDHDRCIQELIRFKPFAVVINVASPNTPDLRDLLHGDYLRSVIRSGRTSMQMGCSLHSVDMPLLFLKSSPDMSRQGIVDFLEICEQEGVDGIIGTNTTTDHTDVYEFKHGHQDGGLSGKPLMHKSLAFAEVVRESWKGIFIYAGGISTHDDLKDVRENYGADLVQAYTGFVYEGPNFPAKVVEGK